MKIYLLLFALFLVGEYSLASELPDVSMLLSSADKKHSEKNYKEAITLYKQAEHLGSPVAIYKLANIYKWGNGVATDEQIAQTYAKKAIIAYKSLADNGDIDAHLYTGILYDSFIKPNNRAEAYKHYLIAAKGNNAHAQFLLANLLEKSPAGKDDHDNAMKWYEKSAKNGSRRAAIALAGDPRDFDSVIKWCLPIAKIKNDRYANKCLELVNLATARKLFPKGNKKAISVIIELANSGILQSQVSLSHLYENGNVLPKDIVKSKLWKERAFNTALSQAENNDKKSQYIVGLFYQKGYGTDIFLDQSERWFKLSAQQNYQPAIKALEELE